MLKVKSLDNIRFIAIHHVGGQLNDPFYSSLGLKASDIDRIHRERWNFKGELGYFGGYTAFIEVDGTMMQFRLIGEETAANKGHNWDTISICLAGNFTIDPINGKMVDCPTEAQLEKLGEVLDWIMKNTKIGIGNIVPHRFLGWTDCYGTGLSDSWAREVLLKYRAKQELKQKIGTLQQMVLLYTKLLDFIRISKMKLGIKFGGQPLYYVGLCEPERF